MSTVQDVLTEKGADVATIAPGATVLDAAKQMNDRKIGSLVVVDPSRRAVGIITERDILTRIVAAAKDPANTRVQDVMTKRLITCSTHSTLDELRGVMRQHRIRHVPVLDDAGQRLLGLVSIGDLNHAQTAVLEETIRYFEQYMYRG